MKKTNLILLILGSFGFLSCLSYYIISTIPNFYSDSYGTSIAYGNKDYLVWSMLFLIIISVAIIHIIEERKKIRFLNINSAGLIFIGSLGAIYYLAKAIESVFDGETSYLGFVISILFVLIISFGVAMIFDAKKAHK
ncbi:MAG: hypothetical protein WCS49_01940 [Bacilli bacterium]